MSRILALDWDHEFLHVIAGSTSRGGVTVDRAFVWSIGGDLTAANGEALGRKLREALKSAGAAAGPVLACVGRERVVAKELRFPPVPAADEPALVRFQASRDLSESPDDVVIDYAKVSSPEDVGERHALAVALKRSTLSALQALCRGAGLKLAAVTTRAHALAGTIERARATGAAPAGETAAVLVLGRRWAELTVLHQGRVLLARSLSMGPALAGEVQRSLAMFTMQNGTTPAPEVLLVAGQRDPVEANLKDLVGITMHRLEPLGVSDQTVEGERGLYAGAVGVAHLWGKYGTLPINFAAPKQPKVVTNVGRQRKLIYGAAAAILVLGALIFGNRVLAGKRDEIARLSKEKNDQEGLLKKLAQDKLDNEGLKEWEESSVSWLDELYDMAARFPHQIGFRLKDVSAAMPTKRGPKDKTVGQVSITGLARPDQVHFVSQFLDALNHDPHLKATLGRTKAGANGTQEFQLKVDIARRPPDRYTTRLFPVRGGIMEDVPEEPDPDAEEGGAP